MVDSEGWVLIVLANEGGSGDGGAFVRDIDAQVKFEEIVAGISCFNFSDYRFKCIVIHRANKSFL